MPAIARMARSYKLHRAIRTAPIGLESPLREQAANPPGDSALVHSNHPPIPRSFIPSTDAASGVAP